MYCSSQRLMVVSLASLSSWAGSGCSLITPHTEALNYDGMKVKNKKTRNEIQLLTSVNTSPIFFSKIRSFASMFLSGSWWRRRVFWVTLKRSVCWFPVQYILNTPSWDSGRVWHTPIVPLLLKESSLDGIDMDWYGWRWTCRCDDKAWTWRIRSDVIGIEETIRTIKWTDNNASG